MKGKKRTKDCYQHLRHISRSKETALSQLCFPWPASISIDLISDPRQKFYEDAIR